MNLQIFWQLSFVKLMICKDASLMSCYKHHFIFSYALAFLNIERFCLIVKVKRLQEILLTFSVFWHMSLDTSLSASQSTFLRCFFLSRLCSFFHYANSKYYRKRKKIPILNIIFCASVANGLGGEMPETLPSVFAEIIPYLSLHSRI